MNEPVDNTIDDYELLCVIGKGVFGKIYLVKEIKTAEVYAMKVVKKILIEQQNKLKYIFTERNLLIEVHPFFYSLITLLSLRLSQLFKTKQSFTSSSSTVQEESSITS